MGRKKTPLPNGLIGRSPTGKFLSGNPGGPGNPHGGQVARLRSLLLDATTDDDIRAVWAALKDKAVAGDLAAIREYLDRTIGKAALTPEPAPAPGSLREEWPVFGDFQRLLSTLASDADDDD